MADDWGNKFFDDLEKREDVKLTREEWIEKSKALWKLLDDIDTMDDVAKERDVYYRNIVREISKKRFQILVSD